MKIKELDELVSLNQQFKSNEDGTIVLINVFNIDPADEEALLEAWSADAAFLKTQPGYISTQMHKGIGGSGCYINYAIWEDLESFSTAFATPEFQALLRAYPESAIAAPHLFKKLAVKGHCVS